MNQILCLAVHSGGQKFKIAILFGIAGTCQVYTHTRTHTHTPYCKIYNHSSSTDGKRYCIQSIPGMWTHCPPLCLIIVRGKSFLQNYISHYHLCFSDFAFYHEFYRPVQVLEGSKDLAHRAKSESRVPGVFVQLERNFIIHPLFHDIISFLIP